MKVSVVIGIVLFGCLTACQRSDDDVGVELDLMGYAVTLADFHRAASVGEVKIMASLLERGIDASGQVDGDTALHVAAGEGRLESVKFLLEKGLSIDVLGSQGRTPLMHAAEANQKAMVEVLLANGADFEIQDDMGYRALTLAAEKGSSESAAALGQWSRAHIDDGLFLATLQGHADTVEVLIEEGASVYARMEGGQTPLMMAAREGHERVVRVLIEHGANRYAVNAEGFTAGQIAVGAGQIEVGEVLLAAPEEDEFSFSSIQDLIEAGMVEMNIAGEETLVESAQVIESGEEIVSVADSASHVVAAVGSEGGPAADRQASSDGERKERVLPVVMKEYRERTLPIRVEGVSGEAVTVRFLYGKHEQVTVQAGEEIPFTGLKVVSVEERRAQTKESGNELADVSTVLVEDPRTGIRRELVTHLSASAHDPFAIMRSQDGKYQVARRGVLISSGDSGQYRVLDVRPTQVVLENLATGTVDTVNLADR